MDLSLSAEQSALHDATARLYAKESHPERVRAAEESGFDPSLWDALGRMGLPTMGGPEDRGYTPEGKPAQEVLKEWLKKGPWEVK